MTVAGPAQEIRAGGDSVLPALGCRIESGPRTAGGRVKCPRAFLQPGSQAAAAAILKHALFWGRSGNGFAREAVP